MTFGMWGECEKCGMQIRADDTCFLEMENEVIVKMICMGCGSKKEKAGD